MGNNKGIDWSSLWKKEDWMSVWIGFLIIAIFMAGFVISVPQWKWLTDSAFSAKIPGYINKIESLAKEAQEKNEASLQNQIMALKSALEKRDRKGIVSAASELEKAFKDVKDEDLKKKSKLASDIKGDAGATIGKIFGGSNMLRLLYILITFWILSIIGLAIMGQPISLFSSGYPIVFVLSALSFLIGGNSTVAYYGMETVFWALIIGLIVSNFIGVPKWLAAAAKTEYFIKIGLVLLGAEVLFSVIMKVGAAGMIQAIIVIFCVFYVTLWLARKFGLDDEFGSILATGVSVCGVSAAIAAGGAVKGDPKKISHTISLVLLCAIPMLIFEPLVAKWVGMAAPVAGAWIGGTIDTTGAVVAAGAIAGDAAMAVAVVVKMAQNVLIGVVAFLLAVWFVFKKKETGETPSAAEIWYRFPKFVVGFIVASIFFSFFLSESFAKSVTNLTKEFRVWWFNLAFISIGLETRFKELISMGRGRPAAAFLLGQAFNIILTLILAYLLFGGIIFAPPKI